VYEAVKDRYSDALPLELELKEKGIPVPARVIVAR
jgi:hypothetical protein